MTSTPTLNGQIIGQAHYATRALLSQALVEAGLDFESWVTLNLIGRHGLPLAEKELVSSVLAGLKIDPAAARPVLAGLLDRGLVQAGPDQTGELSLTAAGIRRFEQLTASIAGLTERLYGDLPAADLGVTAKILTTVTARANAELAG